MAFFAKDPRQQMLLGGGERVSGAEVREQSKSSFIILGLNGQSTPSTSEREGGVFFLLKARSSLDGSEELKRNRTKGVIERSERSE